MKYLAVNSAGGGVLAVLNADGKIYARSEPSFKKAGGVLLGMCDSLFCEAALTPADADFFACCTGPGSFTGIRIGVSAVRAMCQALAKKAAPVIYCSALSYNARSEKNILTLSDAGNGLFYAAAFKAPGEPIGRIECLDATALERFIAGRPGFEPVDTPVTASGLAAAAEREYKAGNLAEYSALTPLYVRKPQAERDLEARGGFAADNRGAVTEGGNTPGRGAADSLISGGGTPDGGAVIIRGAAESDLDAMAAIETKCIECPWTKRMLAESLADPAYIFLCADAGGKAVGYAAARISGADADTGNIAVLPEFRRRGIARRLLKELEDASRAAGAERIFLEVNVNNRPAAALYSGAGYLKSGTRKGYYPDGGDAVVMVKNL
ncbi:MAG: tRNA (adenosine(37)-N6)-threonylcarbamoyltransferase complex dimerization subunit type 1 TsaB [Clostridiales bacterium]|nr:tRNA (adenosine(37)-N6)-threonylcarbamoyltransferase complex dimerization subunit type 1 TsaB [Clostridiales bacterium]